MKNKIGIAGYVVGDYYPKPEMDASFFRANHTYGDEHAFIEGVTFSDEQKVNIVPGTERVFFDFLREHKQSVFPGGGGRNSAYVLSRLGQEVSYFDTSSEPDFELGFNGQKYFANMGHPCRALVLRSPTGTVNIRSTRGDRSKKLEGDFREKLVDFLAQGHDFFVNSLSNEDLALTVAREAKGSLYALVTDHLHRDHRALDRLVQRANSLFFSFSDFYSFAGISPSIDRDKAVDRSTTERVVGDISSMVYDRGLVSPIFVTMGGDGVIAYDPIKSREGIFRVYLQRDEEERLTAHRRANNIGTNKSGDTFSAKVIDNVRNGASMLEATKGATQYIIENLFRFPVDPSKIAVEMIEAPYEPEAPESRIVGDIGVLETTLYPEDDVLK